MTTREAWLSAAIGHMNKLFPDGTNFPPIKVSVGFPKGGRGGHAIGQCWSHHLSEDGLTHHIFVSPEITDTVEVLAILGHELCHAMLPEGKHGAAFRLLMTQVGYVKPFTSSVPSTELAHELRQISVALGTYPHVGLNPATIKKQSTRMLLWECKCTKVRCAVKLEASCGRCGIEFGLKTKEAEIEDGD